MGPGSAKVSQKDGRLDIRPNPVIMSQEQGRQAQEPANSQAFGGTATTWKPQELSDLVELRRPPARPASTPPA